tara:strand:+ start:697 stop:1350 length:654 start_codon:yes stop_codon:yes gene_type:complete
MTAKIKLNAASGGGSVSLEGPASSSADVEFKLPVADGSANQVLKTDGSKNLSFGSAGGITEYDAWVITSDFVTDASSPDYMNSNWARQDLGNSLFEKIGTGMTESSGIFTFPSPGKYQINAEWSINANGVTDDNVLGSIFATHNGSAGSPTYTRIARASVSVTGTNGYNVSAQAMIDVTDVAEIKVRLASDSSNGVRFEGQNGAMRTGIIFKRLGDT